LVLCFNRTLVVGAALGKGMLPDKNFVEYEQAKQSLAEEMPSEMRHRLSALPFGRSQFKKPTQHLGLIWVPADIIEWFKTHDGIMCLHGTDYRMTKDYLIRWPHFITTGEYPAKKREEFRETVARLFPREA
jgi:hypothetical protein